MPFSWQKLSVPLLSGLDTKSAKEVVQLGKLQVAKNVVFSQPGKLAKRHGYVRLGEQPEKGPGELATLADRLLFRASGSGTLFEYAPTGQYWRNAGSAPCLPVSSQVVRSANVSIAAVDAYSLNGFRVVAWVESGAVWAEVVDEANGAVLGRQQVTSAQVVQVQALIGSGGSVVFVILTGTTAHRVVVSAGVVTWDATTYTLFSGVTGVTATRYLARASGNVLYGAAYHSAGITIAKFNSSLSASYTHANAEGTGLGGAPLGLGLDSTGHYIFVAFNLSSTKLKVATAAESTGVVFADNTIDTFVPNHVTVADLDDGNATVFYDTNAGSRDARIYRCVVNIGGTIASGPDVFLRSVSLASDAVRVSDRSYFWATYYSQIVTTSGVDDAAVSSLNACDLLIATDAGDPGVAVGRSFRGTALTQLGCASASNGSSGITGAALVTLAPDALNQRDVLTYASAAVMVADTASARMRAAATLRNLVMAGGSPSVFDGYNVVEAGYHVFPEIGLTAVQTDSTVSAWTGGLTAAGSSMIRPSASAAALARGHLYVAEVGGEADGTEPTWPTNGGTVVDGTIVWRDAGLQTAYVFQASHAYTVGQVVHSGAGTAFVCTTAGTSGSSAPSWPTSGTVTSGTATFTYGGTYGAGLSDNVLYGYIAVYEWPDDAGQLHLGMPSPPLSVQHKAATGVVTCRVLSVTTLRVSDKTDVRIGIYRFDSGTQTAHKIALLQNDPTVDYLPFFDAVTDTLAAEGPDLYCGGNGDGQIPNEPPPACDMVAVWGNRLVANDLEDPFKLWISKIAEEGFGLGWSSLLTLQLDANFGKLCGAIKMDEKLLLFQERRISVLMGDGYDNVGQGSPFSQPVDVATDVGTDNPDSLVVTPLGIMFESAKGLWVISRAMQTDYVGAGVEALFSGPVRGAHVAPRTTQVRFATEEQIFVFDYQVGQWSTFDLDATSAAVWLGQYVYVDREGYVLAESPLGYQDGDGSAYGIQVQIGPLRLDGVQGYGAVRHAVMLFEADGGSIEVQTLDDYGPSAVQVVSHALTPADGLAQVQHFFRHPKTSAVGMVITETDPIIGPFALVGLDLVVGVKGGTKRIPANQRMG